MTTHEARRNQPRGEFQAGYKPVIVRDDLKEGLRRWMNANNYRDSHYERCLASACVEFALMPEHNLRLKQILASAVITDFQITTKAAESSPNHAPA